jgi:hypothetical protein
MRVKFALPVLALIALSLLPAAAQAAGQTRAIEPAAPAAQAPAQPAAQAPRLPPEGSGPLVRFIELRFEPVNESLIEPQTYLYYIQTQPSRSGDGVWVPYNEETEKTLLEDFKRLWGTNFLDNLRVEVLDAPCDNGVVGKRVIFHMEERPRVKIVDYVPADKVDRTKIDEKMKEANVALLLDSFLDRGAVRRVEEHPAEHDGGEGPPVRGGEIEGRGAPRGRSS